MDFRELTRRRVLVADDEAVSRLAAVDMLAACGPLEVVQVDDGTAAWERLQAPGALFDLVCLDVRMPSPDGVELATRIRGSLALRRLPVMLVTAGVERAAQQEAAGLELQGYILKPVGDEAAARVRAVLAHLDDTILEAPGKTLARLSIDAERHRRYVMAFAQLLRTLQGFAIGLGGALPAASVRAQFVQKAASVRTLALTLGAERIEQV
ncbi:MAG TPA: response regulator, partial [Burkholderiaceae bacterium]|nr:response regulator [Burkholderiaceae bacterium]